jgi:hypothetical protein
VPGGPPKRRAERAFTALTLTPALLVLAWLVPGTALLLAGRLVALPMVIIFVPFAVALCYFAMRRLPVRWSRFGAGAPTAAAAGRKADVPAAALVLMVAIAAGFAVWQGFLRSSPVFTAGGPGLYLQYGYWIARHGTARVPEMAAAFGSGGAGGAAGLTFATTGFTAAGGSLTPAALPGLPLLLAGGVWLDGLRGIGGALLMPAALGGCALLSFGGLVGRLCGAWQAVAAELVLGLCLPEVYTARAPFTEPLVQVLLLGGLCLLTDALAVRSHDGRGGLALAGLGGLSLGLTTLVTPFAVGLLLPALPVLAVLFAARRPVAVPFGLGLLAGLGGGLAAGLVLAPSYLSGLAAQLRPVAWCTIGFAVAGTLAMPLVFPGFRALVRRVCAVNVGLPWVGGERLVLPSLGAVAQWLALVLPVVVLVGLAERPYLRDVGGLGQQPGKSGLYWAAWYVGVPALLAACAGAAALGRQAVQGALGGRALGADSALRLGGLPLLVIFWSAVLLWSPSVGPWQPAASRSLVPVVLPGIVLLAVWAVAWLASLAGSLGARRAVVAVVVACCLVALVVPPLATTLNPSLTWQQAGGRGPGGVAGSVWVVRLYGAGATATDRGAAAAASALCASIGWSASVLFTDQATAAKYAPTVRGLCGEPAAVVVSGVTPTLAGATAPSSAPSSAAGLAEAVRAIERAGRRAVLLGPTRSSVSLGGGVPRRVVWLHASGDAKSLTGAPAGNVPVTYSLWLEAPVLASANLLSALPRFTRRSRSVL